MRPAPGVYSQKVLNGGHKTMPVAPGGEAGFVGEAPAQQGFVKGQQQQPPAYGTVQ